MAPQFTFLTVTNPALGEANTKQMRAHVTRKNFEKRRGRLEHARRGSQILQTKPESTDAVISESEQTMMRHCALNPYVVLVESDYVTIHKRKLVLC